MRGISQPRVIKLNLNEIKQSPAGFFNKHVENLNEELKSELSSLGSADLRGENSMSPLRQIDFIEKKPLHPKNQIVPPL